MGQCYQGVSVVDSILGQTVYQNANAEVDGQRITISGGGFAADSVGFLPTEPYKFFDLAGTLLGSGPFESPVAFQFALNTGDS